MCGIRWITTLGVLLAALSTRCGDDERDASDQANAVDGLAAEITSAFCSWQFRCCSTPELNAMQSGRYSTPGECEQSAIAVTVKDQLLLVRTALGEGLMTIDAGKAAACVDAYRNRPCNPPAVPPGVVAPPAVELTPAVDRVLAACPGVFVGQVPDGSRCDMTAECMAGGRCVSGVSGAGGIPGYYMPQAPLPTAITPVGGLGVCTRAQRENEPCTDTAQCDRAANLICREPAFVCGRPPGSGEACNISMINPVRTETLCDTSKGLICDTNSITCHTPPTEGQPCAPIGLPTPLCDTALVCVGLPVNGVGICKPPAERREACGAAAIAPCAAGLACRPTQPDGIGYCDDPPGVGEPCDSLGACANPALCSFYTGRCTMPGSKRPGETCAADEECNTLLCNFINGASRVCLATDRPVVCSGNAVTPGIGMFIPPVPDGAGGRGGSPGSFGGRGGPAGFTGGTGTAGFNGSF